jgi:hypothetical protein
MGRFKKFSNLILFSAAIILAGVIIGIRFMVEHKPIDNPISTDITKDEAKVEEPDLLALNSGPQLGSKMPVMKGVTINGIRGEVSFGVDGKRKVLFFMPIPETCRKCTRESFNQINFLSDLIGNNFNLYLLYNGPAPSRLKIPLAASSQAIIVGEVKPYNTQLKNISPRIFLVDGDGVIKYFRDLPQSGVDWGIARDTVARYAQTGLLPENGNGVLNPLGNRK